MRKKVMEEEIRGKKPFSEHRYSPRVDTPWPMVQMSIPVKMPWDSHAPSLRCCLQLLSLYIGAQPFTEKMYWFLLLSTHGLAYTLNFDFELMLNIPTLTYFIS